MPNHQILIGSIIALLCIWGLFQHPWLLAHSNKCKILVTRFGKKNAAWILISLFMTGILLGILLATDVIRPIQQ